MKVAVLDLGTIFAKLFKSPVSPVVPTPAPTSSGSGLSAPSPSKAVTTSFLLLPPPQSPLHALTTSFPRIPSGRHAAAAHPAGLSSSVPGTPAPTADGPSWDPRDGPPLPTLQHAGGDITPKPTAHPTPILVRPAQPAPSLLPVASRTGGPCRSPRHLQGLPLEPPGMSWGGPSGKQMLFTLPDIGEEVLLENDSDSCPSEAKGLSKGSANHTFTVKDGETLPVHFTRRVQDAIYNYSCESLSSVSSSGQTTPTDMNNSWSGIQSYTTGLSTERSSVYSWRDDEFDKVNTQRVHQLFWDVDEMLFEGKVSSQTQSLQAECKEWTDRSLHLRILGKQLVFPKDEGFQHVQSRTSSSVYTRSFPDLSESSSDLKELCISGSKVIPTASPLHRESELISVGRSSISDSSAYSFLEEEIYDVDGKIEEYLAYDSKEHDDENLEQKKAQLHRRRIKRGIPPISPNACIKDTVAAEVFDDAWRDVVRSLEELITKDWELALAEDDSETKKLKGAGNKVLQIPVSRVLADSGVPPSRGSEARSISFGSHFTPTQFHRMPGHFYSDLNGVMTIQAKPLQQRHAGLIDKTLEQDDKQLSTGSSIFTARNRLGRTMDSNLLSTSRVPPVSSRKTPALRRLPSLTTDPLRSKTPNVYSDEVLRGTKLCTGLDRLSSPPIPMSRNKLPPINAEAVEQHLTVPGAWPSSQRGRYLNSRVSSAVPDSTGRRPVRERTVPVEPFSRPNTTHTFRSDTPRRRSFTPMDFVNHTWTGPGFLTGTQYQPKSFQRNQPATRRRYQVAS
ncbi:protein FAM149A isoform X2 [Pleurodeles waltl]|uniref:protein FAM149A isoform X2 n=1 Tax=Pleurodeles waltl TaxID=8319 RepID=UPI003709BD94